MKNVVLGVLLLSLVIIISKAQYQFGDIIAFDRWKCPCIPPVYKHFAVYVGNEAFPNKTEDQNIFHRSGPNKRTATCIFDNLEAVRQGDTVHIQNYRDHEFTVNQTAMRIRIREMMDPGKCGQYGLLLNNCEHLGTYVRYGQAVSRQQGALFGRELTCPFLNDEGMSCEEMCKPN